MNTTNELLLLRSDVYSLDEDARPVTTLTALPEIDLDPNYYKTISQFNQRVHVVPSLRDAHSLRVRGDWTFTHPLHLTGDATLENTGPQRDAGTGPEHVAGPIAGLNG